MCPSRFHSNVAEDSAWTWWFSMWVSDVHWKLRSTSKKKWTGERWEEVDDGMLLMGFSGDTGKDNSTQWYSRYCAIDNSSGGLTAADAAESSCRFPSGPDYLLPSARPKSQASVLPFERGKIKGIVSQCIQNNSTDNIAIIYRNSGRFYLIESITCVISINEYFLSSLSAWIAIEKPFLFLKYGFLK